jgi:hypothetical protein
MFTEDAGGVGGRLSAPFQAQLDEQRCQTVQTPPYTFFGTMLTLPVWDTVVRAGAFVAQGSPRPLAR